MRLLRMGSTGPAVELLQLALNRAGFGTLEQDGIFGAETDRALRRFQGEKQLTPDGVAGRETERALTPWTTGSVLHRIEKGDTIWQLAQRYGTTPEAVALANPDAVAENLPINGTLVIPLPFPVVPTDISYCAELVACCVRGLSLRYPFLSTGEIGKSVMGKSLWRLTLGTGENKVLYNAAHHANEWITTPLLLRFCEELCAAACAGGKIADRDAKELLDYATLTLVPAVNPDGIDLAAGELQQGEFFRGAQNIAMAWPDIPFPAGWKANIRGTDLNLQYPADWEETKKRKYAQGFRSPAPQNYVGAAPLSAPESRALYDYTLAFAPRLTLSYHTQGEVIFWRYGSCEPEGAQTIGELFARLSGYALGDPEPDAAGAGYKDWFISAFDKPGYTVEAGKGTNPLPLSDFEALYRANLPILTYGALVT